MNRYFLFTPDLNCTFWTKAGMKNHLVRNPALQWWNWHANIQVPASTVLWGTHTWYEWNGHDAFIIMAQMGENHSFWEYDLWNNNQELQWNVKLILRVWTPTWQLNASGRIFLARGTAPVYRAVHTNETWWHSYLFCFVCLCFFQCDNFVSG